MRDSIVGEALAAAGILLIGTAGLVFLGVPVWIALGVFGVAGFLVGASLQ